MISYRNSSTANSTAGTLRASNTSSWNKWKDVPVSTGVWDHKITNTSLHITSVTQWADFHFLSFSGGFTNSDFYTGLPDALTEFRRWEFPSWRHSWWALRGRAGAGSSSRYKGRSWGKQWATGSCQRKEWQTRCCWHKCQDGMRDTDFSCHSLRWETGLTLGKRIKGTWCTAYTKDANLHEES